MDDETKEILRRLRAPQSDGRGRTKTRNDGADLIEAQAAVIDKADEEYEKLRSAIDRVPHGIRRSGMECTARIRELHGCSCWKDDLKRELESS